MLTDLARQPADLEPPAVLQRQPDSRRAGKHLETGYQDLQQVSGQGQAIGPLIRTFLLGSITDVPK